MLYSICISRAGQLDQIYALDLTEYLVKEEEYVPWITALSSVAYIGEMLLGRDGYKYYEVSVILGSIYLTETIYSGNTRTTCEICSKDIIVVLVSILLIVN